MTWAYYGTPCFASLSQALSRACQCSEWCWHSTDMLWPYLSYIANMLNLSTVHSERHLESSVYATGNCHNTYSTGGINKLTLPDTGSCRTHMLWQSCWLMKLTEILKLTNDHYPLPITYTTGQHIWKPFATHTHAHIHMHTHTHTHNRFTDRFLALPGWEDAQQILWVSMVQGKITEADTPTRVDGRHSIQTIQQPTSIIPPYLRRMPFLPQLSHCILTWDRHQICYLEYPTNLLSSNGLSVKCIQMFNFYML